MKRTTSLTTVAQFVPMIADLPLKVVDTGAVHMVVLPTDTSALDELFHALELHAGKRGLKARRGCAVWTVRGFAK
jgi:hypothetical protein